MKFLIELDATTVVLLLGLLGLFVLWFVLRVVRRDPAFRGGVAAIASMGRVFGRKEGLFGRLAEAHRLSGREERTLLRIAAGLRLTEPVVLFVRSSLLKEGVRAGAVSEAQAEVLRAKLFG